MTDAMHKLLRAAAVVAASVVLLGCATGEKSLVEKGLQPLSEAELKSLYSRTRTISWTNVANNSGTGEYRTGGTAQISWGNGGASGTYRIVGNTFCAKCANVGGGVEHCQRVYKTAENKYATFMENGEANSTLSFTN